MGINDELADAPLAAPLDLAGATVHDTPAFSKVVMSARIPHGDSAWILAAANKAGVKPSALLAQLIGEAIASRAAA